MPDQFPKMKDAKSMEELDDLYQEYSAMMNIDLTTVIRESMNRQAALYGEYMKQATKITIQQHLGSHHRNPDK